MKQRLALWLVPRLYKMAMVLILASCRIRFIGREDVDRRAAAGQSWIFVSWHENTAVASALERNTGLAMMASDSRDGEYIARGIALLGNIPVRGSSSKGGSKAVRSMVKWMRRGHGAAITPDGPRGPRRQLQSGVLWIAAMAEAPLVPYHVVATREWTARSWDRHRIPKPFSTVFVAVGESFMVDVEGLKADEAGVAEAFSQRMAANVARAEAACGRGGSGRA